ncbi:MAG: LysM peptidoglycan-binding domain-containing M23 family metallopeptidase [Nitrospinales bacterium]
MHPFRLNNKNRIHWMLIFIGLILLFAGCQSFLPTHNRGVHHTVQKGQTLFSIGKVYGMRPESLARINGIRNPSSIQAGQKLWIPNAIRVMQVPTTVKTRTAKSGANKIKSPQLNKSYPKIARKPNKSPEKSVAVKRAFIWPVKGGVLTSRYGNRNGRKHEGIDIGARTGTPIRAASAGMVMFSGPGPTGYGLMVIVKHSEKLMTVYSHNSKNYVGKNTRVSQGQKLAAVGSTGRSTGPHLHFEVRDNTHAMDPLRYLPKA